MWVLANCVDKSRHYTLASIVFRGRLAGVLRSREMFKRVSKDIGELHGAELSFEGASMGNYQDHQVSFLYEMSPGKIGNIC